MNMAKGLQNGADCLTKLSDFDRILTSISLQEFLSLDTWL